MGWLASSTASPSTSLNWSVRNLIPVLCLKRPFGNWRCRLIRTKTHFLVYPDGERAGGCRHPVVHQRQMHTPCFDQCIKTLGTVFYFHLYKNRTVSFKFYLLHDVLKIYYSLWSGGKQIVLGATHPRICMEPCARPPWQQLVVLSWTQQPRHLCCTPDRQIDVTCEGEKARRKGMGQFQQCPAECWRRATCRGSTPARILMYFVALAFSISNNRMSMCSSITKKHRLSLSVTITFPIESHPCFSDQTSSLP